MTLEDNELELCHRCAAPLEGDPDDDPTGGPAGLPLCGECVRNRDFAADVEAIDGTDGGLGGSFDL